MIIVWVNFSASSKILENLKVFEFLQIILSVFIIHIGLLLVIYFIGKFLKLNIKDAKAMLFTGGQKTLPIAIIIIGFLDLGASLPIIVCLLFYYFQLIFDSFLAVHLSKSKITQ